MTQPLTQSVSDHVRDHVCKDYLKPAIKRGETVLTVNVGDVHRALALHNRVPLVCAALKSRKFLEENGLRLVAKTGPPSGQSTTVTLTYEILASKQKPSVSINPLLGLRGIAKGLFEELGGGEGFIRNERTSFRGKERQE
jgi:hypothetical protein